MVEIKEDDKFFTRLLTKESSKANHCESFRVYYGGVPLGVPFLWEAKPGTPKYDDDDHHHHGLSLPPLTPPPSFSLSAYQPRANKKLVKSSTLKKSKILNGLGLFPRMIMHRRQISLVSTSSSSSSGTDSVVDTRAQTRSSAGSLLDHDEEQVDNMEEEEEEQEEMRCGPHSTLCFGLGGGSKKIRNIS